MERHAISMCASAFPAASDAARDDPIARTVRAPAPIEAAGVAGESPPDKIDWR